MHLDSSRQESTVAGVQKHSSVAWGKPSSWGSLAQNQSAFKGQRRALSQTGEVHRLTWECGNPVFQSDGIQDAALVVAQG